MKQAQKLKELLTKASAICADNIEKADNIDLVSMMETLDSYVEELEEIGSFEVYDEDED